MQRIDVIYGGRIYSIGERQLVDVQNEILAGLADGPAWLEVNDGEGAPRQTLLLIAPGVDIALIPIAGG